MKKSIYFIAVIPDTDTCAEVKRFKTYALRHFDSGRALRSPAHITLEPPFKWEESQLIILQQSLADFVSYQTAFKIQLNNFAAFAPRVIYVDVVKNEKLNQLQAALKSHLRSSLDLISDRPNHPFNPHMTVAFRDLKKEEFPNAWDHFSKIEYRRDFLASELSLLKHTGKQWEVISAFKLKATL